MDFMHEISPLYWASLILISATGFTVLWLFDALTHKELVEVDITDKELQTHRNILVVSVLMEMSLVGMYWWNFEMLPLFLTFFIVRTIHEFIDELHFHTDRCSVYESRLHLGMWVFVIGKTMAMFMWGFFTQYQGIESLPLIYYIWGALILMTMSVVSMAEWQRGLDMKWVKLNI